MNIYVFKEYNPLFRDLFSAEKERLQTRITVALYVDHFGSTAVPGLGGKGIIDIYVIVPKGEVSNAANQLEDMGYEFRPNSGTEDRLFFLANLPDPLEGERRYHVHLTHPDNLDYKKDIVFRDYLREHPEAAEIYAQVKKKAAQNAGGSKEKYMNYKRGIISEIIEKAMREPG